jgi:hypothetical protein
MVMSVPTMSLSIEPTSPRSSAPDERWAVASSISPLVNQFRHQFRPFLTELVGAGQAAVAADHHQPVDAVLEQVAGGASAGLPARETPGSARCR